MSYLGFKSYHINIGAGDSAIHIMYDLVMGQKRVLKAVFLDGGYGVTGIEGYKYANQNIHQTIEDIEADFVCSGPLKRAIPGEPNRRNYLQFDAFMSTSLRQEWGVELILLYLRVQQEELGASAGAPYLLVQDKLR
jgi:hypothetical protein